MKTFNQKKDKTSILKRRAIAIFKSKLKRKIKKQRLRSGLAKYLANIRKLYPKAPKVNLNTFRRRTKLPPRPLYGELTNYFLKTKNAFGNEKLKNESNIFMVPSVFSLADNYKESSEFLRKLFNALERQSFDEIILDYENCNQINVDASICMDIILSDFINHYNECHRTGHSTKVNSIEPRNFEKDEVKKVLFSIGAFRTLKQVKIKFDNVIELPLCIGNRNNENSPKIREVHITKMVDYIIACLEKMNRNLSVDAEGNLYKVIGEVIINAEEHSNTSKRYAIGYFEDKQDESHHFGVFNLAILNFGNSIYETFKSSDCKNIAVVKQMENLSESYTNRNFFKKAEFEEETLWTLYALQQGVTRKSDWKRGNGSIQFIESFFELKGDSNCDSISQMTITSGNARIIFNGEYGIVKKKKGKNEDIYKMMTFNNSGDINEKPDKRFVTFVENFFPGTLITARIYINDNNTENL